MGNNNLYILALWLETIGFGLSVVLILLVKWNVLKGINDYIKSKIIKTPHKISRLRKIISKLISVIRTDIDVFFERKETARWYEHRSLDDAIIGGYFIIAIISIFYIPLFISNCITKYFSRHNAITNLLIVIGTAMIMAGLIIELVMAGKP